MPVKTEVSDKWVRAYVGETAVVDTRAPVLFYEESFPVPGYAFATSDVRTDLLRPNGKAPSDEPTFSRRRGRSRSGTTLTSAVVEFPMPRGSGMNRS